MSYMTFCALVPHHKQLVPFQSLSGQLLKNILSLQTQAQTHTHTHTDTHTHMAICCQVVWFGWHVDHTITSPLWKKRVLLLLTDTNLLSSSRSRTGTEILQLPICPAHFVLAAEACSLLLPLESEPPSVAPDVWPRHALFLYSSLTVAFLFQRSSEFIAAAWTPVLYTSYCFIFASIVINRELKPD